MIVSAKEKNEMIRLALKVDLFKLFDTIAESKEWGKH